jgi:hypothetical protein
MGLSGSSCLKICTVPDRMKYMCVAISPCMVSTDAQVRAQAARSLQREEPGQACSGSGLLHLVAQFTRMMWFSMERMEP